MTGHTRQLDLCMPLTEAARLQEQLTLAECACRDSHWQVQTLEAEVQALRAERDAFQREVSDLAFQLRCTKYLFELQCNQVRAGTAAVPAWLDGELRQLLLVAHPDRAAQWKDAATLGTEVSMVVNALRQRLEGH